MKKIFIVAIAAMLCCVMLVPVSAVNNDLAEMVNLQNDWNKETHPYVFIYQFDLYGTIGYNVCFTSEPYYTINDENVYQIGVKADGYYHRYYVRDNGLDYDKRVNISTDLGLIELESEFAEVKWSNFDVINRDGTVFLKSSICDGSTCPATDVNMDNICDDCGSVLIMSLRNTLYDYALWLAESKVSDGYKYYAIFKSSDTYYVHISKAPMSSPDGSVLEGDGIMYNRVTQSADGTNGGSGWYNGFYESYDEFVEANHNISNFKGALPLAVMILGVAGELITLKLPTLAGILMILTACGVGCLALLAVLKLFGKRLLISRK